MNIYRFPQEIGNNKVFNSISGVVGRKSYIYALSNN